MITNFRSYLTQCIAILTGSLGIISCGIEYGWPSPALAVLFSNSTPLSPPPDPAEVSDVAYMLGILYMGGGVCGMPFTFGSIILLGSRRSILVMGTAGLICWILVATANSLEQIYVARFFSGLTSDGMYVALPMYNAECSQPEVRGFLGSIIYVSIMIGLLVAYLVIPFVPIWASSLFPICLNIIMLSTFFFQPETPYYLLKRSQTEEARKSLQYFRSTDDVSKELDDISAAVARQEAERGRPWDLVRIPSNRKGTLVMLLLNTTHNMAGVSVVVMNAQYLLEEASRLGGVESPLPEEWAAVTFGVVMLLAGSLGAVLIDIYGRRFLLISSGALSAIFLSILAAYYAQTEAFVYANLTWIPLFCLIGYAFAFESGLGLVPLVLNGELFPSSVKAFGMVLSVLCFNVFATISLQIYYVTAESLGLYVSFVIFAVFSVLGTFLIWIYVPETKGKTLEEIQMVLKKQPKKKSNIDDEINIRSCEKYQTKEMY